MLAHYATASSDIGARNGIPLLRHSAGGAPATPFIGLLHLIEFGHHDDLYIRGDLVEETAQDAQEAPGLCDRVSDRMPSNGRLQEAKLFQHALLHRQTLLSKRRERSHSPNEFTHQDADLHVLKSLGGPTDPGEPYRGFIAERKGD